MSNDLTSEIKEFEQKFYAITKENEVISNELREVFNSKVEEITPIIDLFKKKDWEFSHPDLPSASTTLGIIVGRNIHTNRELYVYDDESGFIRKVQASSPNSFVDDEKMSVYNFLQFCDLEFTFKGIEYTRTALQRILESAQTDNEKTKELLKKLKEV